PPVLRPRHRHAARSQFVDDLTEPLGGQILIVILTDHRHRRLGAGTLTFDLFPTELAIGADRMWLVGNPFAAVCHQILSPANHAGRGAAYLSRSNATSRLQLELTVKRRRFKRADIGHAQHSSDSLGRRTGQPAL